MANELPYFRFVVQAWQNGKIDIERYELKGFFIDVCGYYWIQDCQITLSLLKKKFRNDENLIAELIDLGIIKHEKRTDKIEVEFLNIQYDLLSEKRKVNIINGSKGGKAKANAKQTLERNPSYKDNNKDNNKDKDNNNLMFDSFWDLYSKKVGDRTKIKKKWDKLKQVERDKIMETLPAFLNSIKDKQFQPHPETYLNNRRWEDELIQTELNKKSHYFFSCPDGRFDKVMSEEEAQAKTKSGYWTVIKVV